MRTLVPVTLALLAAPAFPQVFDGINSGELGFGVAPPDPDMDLADEILQLVESHYRIFDLNGAVLKDGELTDLYGGAGFPCDVSFPDGDPNVLYDETADRFLVGGFVFGDFCMSISDTGDPTGGWTPYKFPLLTGGQDPEHAAMGVAEDGYYLSFDVHSSIGGPYLGSKFVAFNRAKMLAADPTAEYDGFLFNSSPTVDGFVPVDWDTPPIRLPAGGNYFVASYDDDTQGNVVGSDALFVFSYTPDFVNPFTSVPVFDALIPVTDFDSVLNGGAPSIPQAGGPNLQAASDRLARRIVGRNFGNEDHMVATHTIDVGGERAGVKWYELRSSPTSGFSLSQEGTIAPPDDTHRWMGSIAINAVGDIGISYAASSGETFPGARWNVRQAGDPPGQFPATEQVLANGDTPHTTNNRWGDYSAIAVDPTDDSFWVMNEFASGSIGDNSEVWATRLGNASSPGPAVSYCTSGTSASGCRAWLSASGTPSPTAGFGFVVTANDVEGAKNGILFFGQNGRQANPWGNGSSYQCVAPPVKRAGLLNGVGTAGGCDGLFSQDLNLLWSAAGAKPNHAPTPGTELQLQLWHRDPMNTSNQTTGFSNAVATPVDP